VRLVTYKATSHIYSNVSAMPISIAEYQFRNILTVLSYYSEQASVSDSIWDPFKKTFRFWTWKGHTGPQQACTEDISTLVFVSLAKTLPVLCGMAT
jgi:hypothetical protein